MYTCVQHQTKNKTKKEKTVGNLSLFPMDIFNFKNISCLPTRCISS